MFKRFAAALVCAALLILPARADGFPFADVSPDAWYYDDVRAAWEDGLVNGRSADRFDPADDLTLAEVIKLAACVHCLAASGTVSLVNGSPLWYSTYLGYCIEHGILPENRWTAADLARPATRAETMAVFAGAAELEPINKIPDDSIPDVSSAHPWAAGIYALYRGGAVQGSDELHRAFPDSAVTRAEICAIVNRLTTPDARLRFTLTAPVDFMEDAPDMTVPLETEPSSGEVPTEETPEIPPETGESGTAAPEETGTLSTDERVYSDLTRLWAERYEARFGEGSASALLLTPAEIAAWNARMTERCPVMTDIGAFPDVLSGDTVRALIGAYTLPQGYDFDREGKWISEQTRAKILANRALDAVPSAVTVRRAVVTSRCDLKGQPTDLGFHSYGDTAYSMIQETELVIGTPVAVLHTSADGAYCFVQAVNYAGWIPASSAAFCDAETFAFCAHPTDFVNITAAGFSVGAAVLDMGVTLRFVGEDGDSYLAALPVRLADGTCGRNVIPVPKSKCVRGWLPYTMENFYEQAFACLGVPYGWGGADGGLDCSGFVCAVMRTFGVRIPRNTAEQRVYGGAASDIVYVSAADRLSLFAASRFPVAIHRQSHVMLYLGEADGKLWIIHAEQAGEPVAMAPLDPWSAMLCAVELH